MKNESQKQTLSYIFNVPNTLSFLRILLVPFMAYFLLNNQIFLAFLMVALSGLSDAFDGYFARKLNQVTELGKMLDPIADKLTQVVATVCIAVKFPQLIGILVVFVVKEVLMSMGAAYLMHKNKKPGAARWYGKAATVLFYFSVAVIVLMDAFFAVETKVFYVVSGVLLGLTAVMMLYAFVRYGMMFLQLLKSEDPKDAFDLHTVVTGKEKEGPKTV
ncbi:MAG: CDP-alcohol phosphatidyltransferase family protein [Clostridia bacterium]|nr:CDP-alcohol phosphatidyltransferase family protein [Clostridia bacterium]